MSQPFTIEVRRVGVEASETFSGSFSDAEWDTMLRFVAYADELKVILRSAGFSINFDLEYTKEAGVRFSSMLPSRERVASLLHHLRPFVLDKESTFFPRVCGLLRRVVPLPLFREMLESILGLFFDRDFQLQLILSVNEQVVNSDEGVRLWLNGFEYHRDAEKRARLEALGGVLPLSGQRAVYVSMMVDKANAVLRLASIIEGFKRRAGVPWTIQLRSPRMVTGSIDLGPGDGAGSDA